MPLIEFRPQGLYCSAGGFYIDPWKPVEKAVITHAHSDHARWGHGSYLSHHYSKPILQLRLGDQSYQSIGWNEPITINGVKLSLHPAGHIIGSSQVRVEYKGEVWVVSGDYKTESDPMSGDFEPVPCHTFITESTFGLPIYRWQTEESLFTQMRTWVEKNRATGRSSVFIAYSLGKAQRVLRALHGFVPEVMVHGAIWNTHQALLAANLPFYNDSLLPVVTRVTPELTKKDLASAVVIAPPSADGSPWMKKFQPLSVGVCSGWMQVRGNMRRRNADAGFPLSDHADWNGLLNTVKATGASKVYVTHGFQSAFSRYLNEQGIEAAEVKTEYGQEEETDIPTAT